MADERQGRTELTSGASPGAGPKKRRQALDIDDASFFFAPVVFTARDQEWICVGCGEHIDPGLLGCAWVADAKRQVLVAGHPSCLDGARTLGAVRALVDQLRAGPEPRAAERALNAIRRAAGDPPE